MQSKNRNIFIILSILIIAALAIAGCEKQANVMPEKIQDNGIKDNNQFLKSVREGIDNKTTGSDLQKLADQQPIKDESAKEQIWEKDEIIIKNRRMGEDHKDSFDIMNTYDVTKECWVTMKITTDSEIISSKEYYVGIIGPNQTMSVSIPLGALPQGKSHIEAIPRCESVP